METIITLINQFVEIELKIVEENLSQKFERNFKRIHNTFEEQGFYTLIPIGEKYNESRADYEANLVGELHKNLTITKIIKPIIYKQELGERVLVQKGIVIAE